MPSSPPDQDDTIAAICTGVGGAITILRLAGPDAEAIARRLWRGPALPPRRLTLGPLHDPDGALIDRCLAVHFPAPHSYTGDHVVELHTHGGIAVARAALRALLTAGARHADPGEFTRRAFINGRLDLTQAEAVLDTIQAQSDIALHTAARQLAGLLTQRVDAACAALTHALAEVEVQLDFVDEDLDFTPPAALLAAITACQADLADLLAQRRHGEILRHGVPIVLAGAPNAGKSSLLNRLLGRDRAIVTHIPGTTRDTLEEHAAIRGIPVTLTDTAGLHPTDDHVERQGISRTADAIRRATLVLWIIDPTRPLADQTLDPDLIARRTLIPVINKTDLTDLPAIPDSALPVPAVRLSAITGAGLDRLHDAIADAIWGATHPDEPDIAVNARHATLLDQAQSQLTQAHATVSSGDLELAAISLRAALHHLGQITGRTLTPDILDAIFAKFCIGK